MIEVREPQRVAEEEDRRVVADDVPVALLGIKFEGGAADVAFRIGRAALASDGRNAPTSRSAKYPAATPGRVDQPS
jgi:hypothetical protein